MNPGSSKLNPYAEAYVPLAKRVEDVAQVDSDSSKAIGGSSSGDGTVIYHAEDQGDDGQLEIDLAYLQTHFPGISEQSLTDVYFVNECDVDAACDMLTQLESLPDSLDIGDVSEPQIVPDLAKLKLKEVTVSTDSASAASSSNAKPQI